MKKTFDKRAAAVYEDLPKKYSHRLIGHGPTLWVSTRAEDGQYNLAPVAWNCPVRSDPPKLLLVVGKRHLTSENVHAAKNFIVSVPVRGQLEQVKRTGSVSGRDADKFFEFGVDAFQGERVDAMVPLGVAGFLECVLLEVHDEGKTEILVGEVLRAAVLKGLFVDGRFRVEEVAAKCLHHLGEKRFFVPGELC